MSLGFTIKANLPTAREFQALQDVVIAPEYRGQGVGKAVMQALITQMKHNLPTNCTVGLMAAKDQDDFYTSFSFIPRPNADYAMAVMAAKAAMSGSQLCAA